MLRARRANQLIDRGVFWVPGRAAMRQVLRNFMWTFLYKVLYPSTHHEGDALALRCAVVGLTTAVSRASFSSFSVPQSPLPSVRS